MGKNVGKKKRKIPSGSDCKITSLGRWTGNIFILCTALLLVIGGQGSMLQSHTRLAPCMAVEILHSIFLRL